MVRHTHSVDLIPAWVHKFRQWHTDMFEALDEAHQQEIYHQGGWIVPHYAEFKRLDPNFVIPTEPILARVPPENRHRYEKICSSLLDPSPAFYRDDSPELSGPERCAKRL